MPTDVQRIQTVFLAAAEIRDPADRARFLDGACDGDAELRSRIEALLRAHDQPDSLLDHPTVSTPEPGHGPTQAFPTPDSDPDPGTTRTIGLEGGEPAEDEVPLGFLQPATRPDSLGRLGHYEVLQVLGQGGFGIVFRAFDDVLQRVVAVKVLSPQMAATSPARKRFLREARSSAQVRHENVVQVYEVGEQPLPFLVMEFIPGETLQQRLDRVGPVEPAEVVRVGRQIAEGLAAAHANDLIHRDVKPGNILLEGGAQRVKLTDFGLARAADDASLSQSGIIVGTPMYMAPEQAKGEKLDQRADLFSLGSVLYQMAAGRPPFRANTMLAVLKRVAEDQPRDIREIIPETPPWLCAIIAKLHAKNAADRFQSAREVADVLADCESQLKANARLKDFSRIPRGKARPAGRRKWVATAAILLLPVLALAVTESTGVTQLFGARQAATDPITPGVGSTPGGKQETPPPTYKNGIGMEFVLVPKGKSWLGGSNGKPGDREVEIPADFYLGKYEVTQQEWHKVMGENPSWFSRTGPGKDAVKDVSEADLKRFPVEMVSWNQCQIFVAKLNQLEMESGWVYRLPTETEWEYACRGGPMTDRANSDFDFYLAKPTNMLSPNLANVEGGLKRSCKVGSYTPNHLGLFDMQGNVCEWCDDTVKAADGVTHRVYRGGNFIDDAGRARAAHSIAGRPADWHFSLGLRLARVPSGAPSPEAKTPPADPDRKAAEYVLSLGGAVKVNDQDQKIEAGALPREAFRLTWVRLEKNAQVSDASLAVFKDCNNVTDLALMLMPIGDAGVAHFKDCKNLKTLGLSSTQVGDDGLAHFKDCKQLLWLNLGGTRVTDTGLTHFKDCKNLTLLHLWNSRVGDAGLANFKDCKDLTNLNLAHTKVTGAGLAPFKDCKKLEWLALNGLPLRDADIVPFLNCTNLTRLELKQTQVTEVAIDELKKALPKCKIEWDGVIGPK